MRMSVADAPRVQAEPAQLGGGEAAQLAAAGRRVQAATPPTGGVAARTTARSICARAARRDELAAQRAQQRLGDGAERRRPQPAELADRAAEQRVVAEAAQERLVVVVEPEATRGAARRPRRVAPASRTVPSGSCLARDELGPGAAFERGGEDAVGEPCAWRRRRSGTRGGASTARRGRTAASITVRRGLPRRGGTASSAARSSTSSASDSRPAARSSLAQARYASDVSRRAPCSESRSVARRNASSAAADVALAGIRLAERPPGGAPLGRVVVAEQRRAPPARSAMASSNRPVRAAYFACSLRSEARSCGSACMAKSCSALSRCGPASSISPRAIRTTAQSRCAWPRCTVSSVTSSSAIARRA